MAGSFEGENPTRRYKWFRPRQAMRGYITVSPNNDGTLSLFNNSSGTHLLVVRALSMGWIGGTNGLNVGTFYNQGALGTVGGVVQPLLPSGAALPGLLYSLDDTTNRVARWDYLNQPGLTETLGWWQHDFPFAILEPGWALCAHFVAGTKLTFSAMWEAIYPEELDWLY